MDEKWLVCEVLKGMFSDEVVVRYSSPGNEGYSFFVPKDKVRFRDSRGEVIVRVVEQGGAPYAVIPTEDQAIIPVREEDLVSQ